MNSKHTIRGGALMAHGTLILLAALEFGCVSTMSTQHMTDGPIGNTPADKKVARRLADGYGYSLPSGRVKLTAVKKPGENPTITVETLMVSDAAYQLAASPRASGLSDDEVTFEKEPGTELLKAVTGNYKDKTGEILESIVDTGVKAFKLSQGIPSPAEEKLRFRVDEIAQPDDHYSFVVEFNPFDEKDLKRVQAQLGYKLDLRFFGKLGSKFARYSEIPANNKRIYYRALLPYQVQVTDRASHACVVATVMLPNESPILSVDIKRAFMVEKVNELTFDHGALTKVHTTKPSEVLALFKTLGNVVDKVASLSPIQIKIDQSKAREALLTQQANEMKALGTKFDTLAATLTSQAALAAKEKELERQATADKSTADRARTAETARTRELSDANRVLDDRAAALNASLQREQLTKDEVEKVKAELAAVAKELEENKKAFELYKKERP